MRVMVKLPWVGARNLKTWIIVLPGACARVLGRTALPMCSRFSGAPSIAHMYPVEGIDSILTSNSAGRFTFLSAAFTAVTGCPVDEGLGRAAVELVHPGDRARWLELLRPGFERAAGETGTRTSSVGGISSSSSIA